MSAQHPLIFIHIAYPEPLYASTADRPYQWGGQTWHGLGELVSLSEIKDALGGTAERIELGLSGFDAALLRKAMDYKLDFSETTLYVGFTEPDGTLISTPTQFAKMLINPPKISTEGVVTAELVTPNERWNVPSVTRTTDAEHQYKYPGDLFFQFLPQIQDVEISWGNA